MLTLFSIPKACEGHIGIIQRNAFESWKRLGQDIQIILLGSDPGVAEAAEEFGFDHHADIECTESGIPLVHSIFLQGQEHARFPVLCYVNADIVLLSDFIETVQSIDLDRFLLVGQRWNLDVLTPIEFEHSWEAQLRHQVEQRGQQAGKYAIDYFVFNKDLFGAIPPFVIGRFHWDNWLLFRARNRGASIVDVSDGVLAIHQNHGYGKNESLSEAEFRQTPEVRHNHVLTGGYHNGLDLDQANYMMKDGQLCRRAYKDMGPRNFLITKLAAHPFLYKVYDLTLLVLERAVPEFIKKRLRPLVLGSP